MGSVDKQLSGFGKSAGKIGGLLKGAFAGVAVGAAFKNVVQGASDAQQSLGATQAVFGKYSKSVIADSDAAATKFGLSANSYRESANLIGSQLKNAGVPMDQLGAKTKTLIGRASDLSAVFGGSVSDATQAMSSAFKGEFDPLEKYGVTLNMTAVNAELAARGQDKLKGKAAALAKQAVISDLIFKQSNATAGQFSKQTNTLAEQQQILAAKFQNVKDKIGTALLPIITQFVSFLSSTALPAVANLGQTFDKYKGSIIAVAAVLGTLIAAERVHAAFMAVQAAGGLVKYIANIKVVQAMTRTWAAVQWILNAALTANPIGLVIAAIAALAIGLVIAYKKSETFRNIVNTAFGAIKKVISAVMPVVVAIVKTAFSAIKAYVTLYVRIISTVVRVAWKVIQVATKIAWGLFKVFVLNPVRAVYSFVKATVSRVASAVGNAWNTVKSKTNAIWNGIKNAVSNAIAKVLSVIRSIHGKITGAFSGAGSWLVSTGRNIVQGLINGITGMAGALASKVRDLASSAINTVKGAFKTHSPSKVMEEIGVFVVQGLAAGLANSRALSGVTQAASKMTTAVGSGFESPTLNLSTAGGTSGNTYNINVNAPTTVDKAALGREITLAIDAYARQGGRRRA